MSTTQLNNLPPRGQVQFIVTTATMGSISDIWASFETLDPESDQIPRIQSILHNADWEYLITQAVQLRQQEQPESSKTLTCSVDTTRFTCGFNNLVVALTFSDSVQWIARVALPQENEDDKAYQLLLSEIATMRLVRARTTIPIAEIFAFGPQTDDFGFAFILMEALPGRILDDRLALSVPAQYMKHFVTQLATYVYELSCVKFEKIGCIVPDDSSEGVKLSPSLSGESRILSTSLEYFYRLRKRETKAILKAHKGEQQWEAAAWFLEKAVTSMVTEEHMYGPFPLCHLDLHFGNILVDENYNITGILDWSHAQIAPVERFAISPEFIAPPAAPAEFKQAVFYFRDLFIKVLGKIEEEREADSGTAQMMLSRLIASPLSEVVYRCTYSYHWRAIYDAPLILPLLYGEDARWEDFQRFYAGSVA